MCIRDRTWSAWRPKGTPDPTHTKTPPSPPVWGEPGGVVWWDRVPVRLRWLGPRARWPSFPPRMGSGCGDTYGLHNEQLSVTGGYADGVGPRPLGRGRASGEGDSVDAGESGLGCPALGGVEPGVEDDGVADEPGEWGHDDASRPAGTEGDRPRG